MQSLYQAFTWGFSVQRGPVLSRSSCTFEMAWTSGMSELCELWERLRGVEEVKGGSDGPTVPGCKKGACRRSRVLSLGRSTEGCSGGGGSAVEASCSGRTFFELSTYGMFLKVKRSCIKAYKRDTVLEFES